MAVPQPGKTTGKVIEASNFDQAITWDQLQMIITSKLVSPLNQAKSGNIRHFQTFEV